MTIYIRLKELRKQKGMTQQQIAMALGMAVSSIQKIEAQKNHSMPWDTVEKLCNLLDCKPGDLIIQERLAPTSPTPPSPKLLSLLPMPTQIVAVEKAIILRAVPSLVERMEELAHKERTAEEEEEFGAYLELDDLISLVNRKFNQ